MLIDWQWLGEWHWRSDFSHGELETDRNEASFATTSSGSPPSQKKPTAKKELTPC